MKQKYEIIEIDSAGNERVLNHEHVSPVDAVIACAFAGLPDGIQSRQVRYAENLNCEVEPFDSLDENDQQAWVASVQYAVEVYVRAMTA